MSAYARIRSHSSPHRLPCCASTPAAPSRRQIPRSKTRFRFQQSREIAEHRQRESPPPQSVTPPQPWHPSLPSPRVRVLLWLKPSCVACVARGARVEGRWGGRGLVAAVAGRACVAGGACVVAGGACVVGPFLLLKRCAFETRCLLYFGAQVVRL
jgi:hypothetical protein